MGNVSFEAHAAHQRLGFSPAGKHHPKMPARDSKAPGLFADSEKLLSFVCVACNYHETVAILISDINQEKKDIFR